MNELKLFNFRDIEIRVFKVGDIVWFVAKDCALALGYKDTVNAIKLHCKNSCQVGSLARGGKTPPLDLQAQTKVIKQPDLIRLIINSHLEQAQEFERKVMEEIIPSVLNTGVYGLDQALEDPTFLKKALLINLEKVEQLTLENKKLTPKANQFDSFLNSKEEMTMQEAGGLLDIGRNTFMADLRRFGYLTISGLPYRKYIERGWFKIKADYRGYKFAVLTHFGFQHISSKHYGYSELFGFEDAGVLELRA